MLLNECTSCPNIQNLRELLKERFPDTEITQIRFTQWVSKPRTSLETFVKDSTEFIDEFCEAVVKLRPHSFIAKSQGNYIKYLKETLSEGEFLVICDFAENYAFVIQDAAPGYHWNNAQATIYTVVIYYRGGRKSLAIISDCTTHDTVAVHHYNKTVIEYIKTISNRVKKICYFSDGAP